MQPHGALCSGAGYVRRRRCSGRFRRLTVKHRIDHTRVQNAGPDRLPRMVHVDTCMFPLRNPMSTTPQARSVRAASERDVQPIPTCCQPALARCPEERRTKLRPPPSGERLPIQQSRPDYQRGTRVSIAQFPFRGVFAPEVHRTVNGLPLNRNAPRSRAPASRTSTGFRSHRAWARGLRRSSVLRAGQPGV